MWGLFHLNVPHTQKDDKSRPIFNLRGLNHYIRTTHFKMEGPQRCLLCSPNTQRPPEVSTIYIEGQGVPVHVFPLVSVLHHESLRSSSNQSWPTCRGKGVRSVIYMHMYIDNILLFAGTKERARDHTAMTLDFLEALGFLVNYPKSQLTPSQTIVFLGFQIDSKSVSLSLREEKETHLRQEALRVHGRETVSASELAQLIGKLSAVMQPAPLHYRVYRD